MSSWGESLFSSAWSAGATGPVAAASELMATGGTFLAVAAAVFAAAEALS
jgi:hypothetical protein